MKSFSSETVLGMPLEMKAQVFRISTTGSENPWVWHLLWITSELCNECLNRQDISVSLDNSDSLVYRLSVFTGHRQMYKNYCQPYAVLQSPQCDCLIAFTLT